MRGKKKKGGFRPGCRNATFIQTPKDAAAEANNVIIGGAQLDVDQARAVTHSDSPKPTEQCPPACGRPAQESTDRDHSDRFGHFTIGRDCAGIRYTAPSVRQRLHS